MNTLPAYLIDAITRYDKMSEQNDTRLSVDDLQSSQAEYAAAFERMKAAMSKAFVEIELRAD
ncbi:hypothetical protein LPB79_13075 [Rhizobium sp. T136]|uniref:hypothetical protein n=1 Tax=Rhizobium sp. T136 TaxID=555319 RepID=UPI001E6230C3|nr:hypothetical protein [Rhizobium sp. T136]UFS83179.1 hypothetical protein LPB79_13075 [Rhizobium sp. T136]